MKIKYGTRRMEKGEIHILLSLFSSSINSFPILYLSLLFLLGYIYSLHNILAFLLFAVKSIFRVFLRTDSDYSDKYRVSLAGRRW